MNIRSGVQAASRDTVVAELRYLNVSNQLLTSEEYLLRVLAEAPSDGVDQTARDAAAAAVAESGANAIHIANLQNAQWTGEVFVTPHEIPSDATTFTLNAFLHRVTGTFPNGARMRINASGRNGAFVHAVDETNTPATLAFDATQARNALSNPVNGLLGGNPALHIYDSTETDELATIPIRLPVVTVVAELTDLVLQAAVDAASDTSGVTSITLPVNYNTDYRDLIIGVRGKNEDRIASADVPLAMLAAQAATRPVVLSGNIDVGNLQNVAFASWNPTTRVITMNQEDRIIYAVLERQGIMQPTTRYMNNQLYIKFTESERQLSADEKKSMAIERHSITGDLLPEDYYWIAFYNGHEFGVAKAELDVSSSSYSFSIKLDDPHEYNAHNYYPADKRTKVSDWVGAARPKLNEDSTAWLPEHCDEDYMHDRESILVTALTNAFYPTHRRLSRETNGALVSNLVQRFKDSALDREGIIDDFHTDTEANLREWARSLHIGHYHQNPHDAHINVPIENALLKTAKEWQADTTAGGKGVRFTRVAEYASNVFDRAGDRHEYEDRWDQVERIAREKAAAIVAGTDPVDGYEYIYCRSVTGAAITNAADLPDPTWAFDHLRNGRILRGGIYYYDGEPETNAFFLAVIRFKRPIAAGTLPGESIGSVAWEQEKAYRPTSED